MSVAKYHLIFKGEIHADRNPNTVKKCLAKLLKTDGDTVEKLFSSSPVVIRKSVDIETAARYRNAFRKAGAVCEIIPEKPPE
jgi:hypothetical protein